MKELQLDTSLFGQFKIKISDWMIQGKTSNIGRCERLWVIAKCPNNRSHFESHGTQKYLSSKT